MLQFDENMARRVEEVYMTPDVVAQRRVSRAALGLRPGERVLDIGAGPGFLVTEMAEEVGSGRPRGRRRSQREHARHRPPAGALARCRAGRAGVGDALSLPFDAGVFDAAVSTQVLEYIDDVGAALAEARRVLRPGGRLLVLDTDWDSIVWGSSDGARMRRVLEAWNEHLADPYLPRRLPGLLALGGLRAGRVRHRADPQPWLRAAHLQHAADRHRRGLRGGAGGGHGGRGQGLGGRPPGLGDDYFFSLNRYQFVATR